MYIVWTSINGRRSALVVALATVSLLPAFSYLITIVSAPVEDFVVDVKAWTTVVCTLKKKSYEKGRNNRKPWLPARSRIVLFYDSAAHAMTRFTIICLYVYLYTILSSYFRLS